MTDPRTPVFDGLKALARAAGTTTTPTYTQTDVNLLTALFDRWGVPRQGAGPIAEPAWVTFGRSKIGEREIPGPKHNSWIVSAWKRLGAGWFTDDETPWCGNFVAQCMEAAGLTWPKDFARAKAWADYGTPLSIPAVGAIGVKLRTGGGHVFIIVGETADKRFFKVLEGNANNMVRIGDIAKSDVIAIRWPPGSAMPAVRTLPVMPKGTIAESEA